MTTVEDTAKDTTKDTGDTDKGDRDWESMYGQVVWAKIPSSPWWPSYVFDPDTIANSGIRNAGQKKVGKEYVVYFYGTDPSSCFGFVKKSGIIIYDDAKGKKHATQAIAKKYAESFAAAMVFAEEEMSKPIGERASWCERYVPPAKPRKSYVKKAAKVINEKDSSQVKKKRGRKPKKIETEVENGVDYFAEPDFDMLSLPSEPGDLPELLNSEEELEQDLEQEENDDDVDEEYASEEDSEPIVKKKRGRPRKNAKMAEDTSHPSDENDKNRKEAKPKLKKQKEMKEPARKKARIEKPEKEKKEKKEKKPVKEKKKKKENEIVTGEEESKIDRVLRLIALTRLSTELNSPDAERAVRCMRKLSTIAMTLQELSDTGAASLVNSLRKHPDTSVAKAARELREVWMDQFKEPEKTNVVSNVANSAKVEKTQTPAIDRPNGNSTVKVVERVPSTFLPKPEIAATNTTRSSFKDILGLIGNSKQDDKVEEKGFNIDKLPENIRNSTIRMNAVRFLFEGLSALAVAVRVEEQAYQLFSQSNEKNKYFECVTKCGVLLKKKDYDDVRKRLLANCSDTEMITILSQSFSYIKPLSE